MSEPDYMKLRDEWENILSDPNYSAEFVGNVCRSHKETILSALSLAADAGRLRTAMRHILPYLEWTIGPESPGHHPTMPSAVEAFKCALITKEQS